MRFRKVILRDFRNLVDSEVDLSSDQILLTGENGQGKTNLLEVLYLLSYGGSFRTQNLREAVRHGCDGFHITSEFEDADGFVHSSEVRFSEDKKTILLDGREIHDRKEIIYSLPCIVFSHDDIEIVRGEPENRRRFFDQTMTMYDPVFFDDLRLYKQVLRQRNAVLKEGRTDLLDVYDRRLAETGLPVMKAREKACQSFSALFPDIYEEVARTGRKVEISYRPSWDVDQDVDSVYEKLVMQREVDLKMNTTTSGPHRDRYVITEDGRVFTNSASTGQMRLASLVFRSAQAMFYRKQTGKDPIFLIDDVLLELDPIRRSRYLDCLGRYNQAFFTFLPGEKYFSEDGIHGSETLRYDVREGEFVRI